MQPGAPRWIGSRKFMPSQVSHGNSDFKPSGPQDQTIDGNLRGFRFQMLCSSIRRRQKFLRESPYPQVAAKPVEHSLHKEVSTQEHMPRNVRPWFAQYACNRHLFLHHGHVTRLATLRFFERTMKPFLVGHLL